jgi:hypothetical protein
MRKIMYVATVALMASGMVWAQSSTTPSTQDTTSGRSVTNAPQTVEQSEMRSDVGCSDSAAEPNRKPGAMSAPETANQATSPKGATPAKCQGRSKKSASDDYDAAERAEAGRR